MILTLAFPQFRQQKFAAAKIIDVLAHAYAHQIIESLSKFEQMNLTSKNSDHPAYQNAIRMSEAVANNEVIYFYLKGAVDSVAVSEIGRLAIFSFLNACIAHKSRTGKKPHASLIVDEAQHIVAKNTGNILAHLAWAATSHANR